MKKKKLSFLVRAAAVAAVYVALGLIFAPISFGAVQFRIAEVLCILPFFGFYAVPGLGVGCLLLNLIGLFFGLTILPDVFIGTAATFIAALLSYFLRKNKYLVPLPAVITNAIFIGLEIHYFFTPEISIIYNMIYVLLGQALACYALGLPILIALDKNPGVKKLLTGEAEIEK